MLNEVNPKGFSASLWRKCSSRLYFCTINFLHHDYQIVATPTSNIKAMQHIRKEANFHCDLFLFRPSDHKHGTGSDLQAAIRLCLGLYYK